MANSYLIDLGINDSLQDVVRKCNANFRQVSKQGKSSVRQEATRSDQMLEGAVGSIEAAVDKGLQEIDAKMEHFETEVEEMLKEARDKVDAMIEEIKADTTPPVGTWIHCDYDPNDEWPDTEWDNESDITQNGIPLWHRVM